ncbi:phosphoglycolate phosphatase [Desulfobotulus alkaliphilus]|uniref:Phosphoglycolate phosphatase n=1 Tax=Desulfobotulus alkaliphilus TaxID=622671 RepID=A0A562RXJ0_9BACT|nr:HAD family hydrolase [Desulfobotulus alkaliphilus]TWI73036.1 phosphoglycolate phosphatase [Desulfobotulus alkaliphilus]
MRLCEKFDVFLFDLDGTLTDPKEGITKSVQYALNKMGIIEENLENLIHFIGPPLKHSFMTHYGFSEGQAMEAIACYREYFTDRGMFENFCFKGIDRILNGLVQEKKKLFVATSKPTVFAKTITDTFGLSSYFEEVVGSELDGSRCEKASVIRYIFDHHGIEKAKTLMIGDREHDVIGARENGIASLGVGFGYGSREELEKAGADFFAASLPDLEKMFF